MKEVEIVAPSGKVLTAPLKKHHDIFVRTEETKETIYLTKLERSL